MSHVTIAYGKSGSGKTTAAWRLVMDELNKGKKVIYINVTTKVLPFKHENLKDVHVDDADLLSKSISEKTECDLMVIDDFTYFLRKQFVKTADEKGYTKFSMMAKSIAVLFDKLRTMNGNVLILNHLDSEDGHSKMSTVGKLLDEKYNLLELSDCNLALTVTEEGHKMVTNTASVNGLVHIAKTPLNMYNEEESVMPLDFVSYYERVSNYKLEI